jgi:hypothetical protein
VANPNVSRLTAQQFSYHSGASISEYACVKSTATNKLYQLHLTTWQEGGADITNCTARNRLAAFNASTGAATSFNPDVNNIVYAVRVSGSTAYAGGAFTSINQGTTPISRAGLAAFDTTTGIATSFDVQATGTLYSLFVNSSALYSGGAFTLSGTQSRTNLASFDIISTPTPVAGGSACSGAIAVAVTVNGGSASPVDARLSLDGAGMSRDSTYTLSCGSHIISTTALPGYTHSWSGDCSADGSVLIDRNASRTCSAVYTFVSPAEGDIVQAPASTPSTSPTPPPSAGGTLEGTNLSEGDTVSAMGSNDPDVYIVNTAGFKRLFLNPIIFSFYGHLGGFSKVKSITPSVRDSFPTSGLFRNCETNEQAVYAVETTGEDTGILHHVVLTGDQAVAQDPDFFKKVFCINTNEFTWYTNGADYTSLSQVPVYSRF